MRTTPRFTSAATAAAIALGLAFAASPAHAEFVIDNMTIDFSGNGTIDGLDDSAAPGIYTYNGVELLGYVNAIAQATFTDSNDDLEPSVGEVGRVIGFGNIDSLTSTAPPPVTNEADDSGVCLGDCPDLLQGDGGAAGQTAVVRADSTVALMDNFEVTFFFDVGIQVFDIDANDANFDHLAADDAANPAGTTGLLTIRVDNLGDGGTLCDTTGSAANCTDGVEIAIFSVTDGAGVFDFESLNGDDVAEFDAVFLAAGVWFDEFGNDLACDSLDADDTNDCSMIMGKAGSDFNTTEFAGSTEFDCPQTAIQVCVSEDGTFGLLRVPEPTVLTLFAVGLVALGLGGRLRHRRGDA